MKLPMKDVNTLVSGIEYKLGKLIDHYLLQRIEIEKYKKEISSLNETVKDQKTKISQLEEKIKILKIAKTLESKEGNVEAKLKINELVREIDKCIGLLNT